MTTRSVLILVVVLFCCAHGRAAEPELLKVFTAVTPVGDIAVDGDDIWCAGAGGVQHRDKKGKWTFFTRHDGLAANDVFCVVVRGDKVYAFFHDPSRFSILDKAAKRWRTQTLDPAPPKTFGLRGTFRHVLVFPDSIWYVAVEPGDMDFRTIKTVQLRECSLRTGKVARRIDLLALERKHGPRARPHVVGLAGDAKRLWLVLGHAVIRVDSATGETRRFALAGDLAVHGGIRCMTVAGGSIWLGLDHGLGRFDTSSGRFEVVLRTKVGKPFRAPRALAYRKGILWIGALFPGLARYDTKARTLKVLDAEHSPVCAITCGEQSVWVVFRSRLARLHLPDTKWEYFLHPELPELPVYGQAGRFLFEDKLVTWVGNALHVYELKTSRAQHQVRKTGKPLAIVPDGEKFWMLSMTGTAEFHPVTGKWVEGQKFRMPGRTVTRSHLIASEGNKYWFAAHSVRTKGAPKNEDDPHNGEHFLVFDKGTGVLKEVLRIPEKMRQQNTDPLTVCGRFLYARASRAVTRYDTKRRMWENLPIRFNQSPNAATVSGTVWLTVNRRIVSWDEDGEPSLKTYFVPKGYFVIGPPRIIDRNVDFVVINYTRTVQLRVRYDGKQWSYAAAPMPPRHFMGLDRNGKPTGTFAVFNSRETTIWRGRPKWLPLAQDCKPLGLTVKQEGIEFVLELPPLK